MSNDFRGARLLLLLLLLLLLYKPWFCHLPNYQNADVRIARTRLKHCPDDEMRFESSKCVQCVYSRNSASDPAQGAYSATPNPLAAFLRSERSGGNKGEGKAGTGQGEGKEERKVGATWRRKVASYSAEGDGRPCMRSFLWRKLTRASTPYNIL